MPFVSVLSAGWAASDSKFGDTAVSSQHPSLLMDSLLGDIESQSEAGSSGT